MTDQRIDRILDERFVADLADISTDELRRRRAEVEAEEEAVSYVRRLLQGRLDILRAELVRRTDDGNRAAAGLLSELSTVLSEKTVSADRNVAHSRATRLRVPDGAEVYLRRLDAELDSAVFDALGERSLTSLEELIGRVATQERELSSVRRQLFDRVDALRDELARRYKDGRAAIGDLLAER